MTRVRLTRKYADMIDGVDLTDADVGDRLDLTPHDAEVLIAEGWAEPAPGEEPGRRSGDVRSTASDKPGRRKRRGKR